SWIDDRRESAGYDSEALPTCLEARMKLSDPALRLYPARRLVASGFVDLAGQQFRLGEHDFVGAARFFDDARRTQARRELVVPGQERVLIERQVAGFEFQDRKSTRLNSSHV